jgi:hypothetical protein
MVGLSALSAGVGAMGAMQQSQAVKDQNNYQAQVARNNAVIASQNAASINEQGEIAQQEHRRKVKTVKGAARAQQASKGFLVDDTADSTNIQQVADIIEMGKLDELRIKHNVALEERRALIQGTNFQAQAGLYSMKASAQNPFLSGASTLLAGAASTLGAAKQGGLFKSKGP